MDQSAIDTAKPLNSAAPAARRFYYGWVNVVIAALAMTATLPGRTHGLGLITQPLLQDPVLGVNEQLFSQLNFWGIILGSLICLPVGRLIDRVGARPVLMVVSLGLGLSVLAMSRVTGVVPLLITLVLIRGLGQGALSVVSMALVGKWFTKKLGHAMGVFTVLMAFGFIGSVLGMGSAVKSMGWRPAWAALGWFLVLGMTPLGALFARSSPEAVGVEVDGQPAPKTRPALDLPLGQALRAPAFWIFTLSMSLYNMAWSAVTLFNESLLQARHLDGVFVKVMGVMVVTGLPANLVAGWLATRWSMGRLLAVGMAFLALTLAGFPLVTTESQAMLYATGLGVSGGIITVVFFAVYGHAFGRQSLGAIQAVAQIVSVLASATGPMLLTEFKARQGSADPLFPLMGALAIAFAVACWWVQLPSREQVPSPA